MATFKGLSAFLLAGSLILLILASKHLSGNDSLNPPSAIHGQAAVTVGFTPTPISPRGAAVAHKVALQFGIKTELRLGNSSADFYGGQHANVKRSDWTDALSNGAKLLGMLRPGPRTETPFLHKEDLTGPASLTHQEILDGKGKGWVITNGEDITPPGYETVFEDLHIPADEANIERDADQNVPFVNCKRNHNAPTGGKNYAFYNPKGKTITSANNYSPMFMLREAMGTNLPRDWPDMLPNVQRWSDIVWILWEEIAGPAASELKYIFKHDVITDETKRIMEHVMAAAAGGSPKINELEAPWPGKEFRLGSPEFVALLGTPHGRGIVYFLIQHPNELPGKSLESIRVFTTEDFDYGYHLLFTLSGVGN